MNDFSRPLNRHAHQMATSGTLGEIRMFTGHCHQDGLAKAPDRNWRLKADQGGALRPVGDIGTHRVDLSQFIPGPRATHVLAKPATFAPLGRARRGQAMPALVTGIAKCCSATPFCDAVLRSAQTGFWADVADV